MAEIKGSTEQLAEKLGISRQENAAAYERLQEYEAAYKSIRERQLKSEPPEINWCDSIWNPVTGCQNDCEYCSARGRVNRSKEKDGYQLNENTVSFIMDHDGNSPMYELNEPCFYEEITPIQGGVEGKSVKAPYPYGFAPTFHKYKLNAYAGKEKRNIAVCPMADLFGSWVPVQWIEEVFAVCKKSPQHNYLFLTKNPQRYAELAVLGKLPLGDNMWYGASITNIAQLEETAEIFADLSGDRKLFLGIDPLHEDITRTETWKDFCKNGYVDWVIIGAEAEGQKNRVVPEQAWIASIAFDLCCEMKQQIPLFMKESLAGIWRENGLVSLEWNIWKEKNLIQQLPKELMS